MLTSAALRGGLAVCYLLLGIFVLATGHTHGRTFVGIAFLVLGTWYAAGFVAQRRTVR
ncbi:MAG: hypothetical protein ABSA48_16340 [Terracidiphilus sp.]|jgi:hydrogenase/urease accessory protein HupE